MISSFIETYIFLGYSIFIPLIIFIFISLIFYLLLSKADAEKTRSLLLRMEFFILFAILALIFIFAICIVLELTDRELIYDWGITTIAGMTVAFILTNFIYLFLMIGIFTLMVKKFDSQLFEVPMYSGFRTIFERHAGNFLKLIFYVSFFLLSGYLIGQYFENPRIVLYIYLFIYLLIYVFAPAIRKFFGRAVEIRNGEIFDNYMNLLKKTEISYKKLSIIESPYGFANAWAVGLLPGFTEIFLLRPLEENLNGKEMNAILAHELAHIKDRHILIRYLLINIFIFILGQVNLLEDSTTFSTPMFIIFFIGYFIITRKQEQNADTFAAKLTSPEDLVSALKKIDFINRKARGESMERSHFEKTGRRSAMDVRCDDIMKRCGMKVETKAEGNTENV